MIKWVSFVISPISSINKTKYLLMLWSSNLFVQFISGFDAGELSEDGSNDWEALDTSAAHIANLLSTEPADGTFKAT